MKPLLVIFCVIAGVFAQNPIGDSIVDGPICKIFDPSHKEGPIAINVVADPVVKVQPGSSISNVNVEGLSTESWTLLFNIVYNKNKDDYKLGRLNGNATYSAHGYLDASPFRPETLPSGNFTGAGLAKFAVSNVQFKANFSFILNSTDGGASLKVSTLSFDSLSFDSVSVDLGDDFVIDGKTPNWAEFSSNFKENFDQDFAADREGVTEVIRQIFNGFTSYTLNDLLGLVDEGLEC